MVVDKKCSVIIRTRNEERWISSCLSSVFRQDYSNFEVILVDNQSTDQTLKKVAKFPSVKIEKIDFFTPGAALNIGIRASSGEYIVCLSGHCIPTSSEWLRMLVDAIESCEKLAGVYGRQEPMSFSSAADKRDLLLVFGRDKRTQIKDSFFHNANSILRRVRWNEVPFNEAVRNIEDRVWGQEMISRGYKLSYEPNASVYHHHGIHHGGDNERCESVVRIIEALDESNYGPGRDPSSLFVLALIPQRGQDHPIGGSSQLGLTIEAALGCTYVDRVIVSTDNSSAAQVARLAGAETPFLREKKLSQSDVTTDEVMQDSLQRLEDMGILPDLIVYLEPTFPFRPKGLLDVMVQRLLVNGVDSLFAGKRENGAVWRGSSSGERIRVDGGDGPRKHKEQLFVGLKGLGLITYPDCIRSGKLYGPKIGVYPTDDPLACFEVRDDLSRDLAVRYLNFVKTQR